MKTYTDNDVRVVSLSTLEQLCAQASGTCHRYSVTKVSRSRVHVTYSNPNEYGTEFPMTAVFPCFPGNEPDNPNIVLEFLNILHDNWDGEGWQAFDCLRNAPQRNSSHYLSAHAFFQAKREGAASGGWDESEWLESRFFGAILHTLERAGYPTKDIEAIKREAKALADAHASQ